MVEAEIPEAEEPAADEVDKADAVDAVVTMTPRWTTTPHRQTSRASQAGRPPLVNRFFDLHLRCLPQIADHNHLREQLRRLPIPADHSHLRQQLFGLQLQFCLLPKPKLNNDLPRHKPYPLSGLTLIRTVASSRRHRLCDRTALPNRSLAQPRNQS